MTLIEVVVVVTVVLLLVAMLLPTRGKARAKPGRLKCVNNSKQIGTAFRVFASDNDDRYPLQATHRPYLFQPGETGTASGAVVNTNAQAWQVYQAMWNELQSPRVLLCPADRARATFATFNRVWNFNELAGASGMLTTNSLGHPANRNLAVSYAPQTLADESRPLGLLTVDRCIDFGTAKTAATAPGAASGTRIVVDSAASANALFFTGGAGFGDPADERAPNGTIGSADGSVELANNSKHLQAALLRSGATNGWGTASSNGWGASVFLIP